MQKDGFKAANAERKILLSGRLDFNRRQEFLGAVDGFFAAVALPTEVAVDCSDLTYLDSSGLGMLLILRDRAREQGRGVALLDCSEHVRAILNTVQFGRLFRLV